MDKFETTLEMMQEAIAAHPMPSVGKFGPLPTEEVQARTTVWEKLYTYVFANFSTPEDWAPYMKEVYDLLWRDSPEIVSNKLFDTPTQYSEAVFPIAVARYMVMKHGLSPDTKQSTLWKEFDQRYTTVINRSLKG